MAVTAADLEPRVRTLEMTIVRLPEQVQDHENRLRESEKFKYQLLAIALIGSTVGSVLSGFLSRLIH